MAADDYFIEIFKEGTLLGAGFLLTQSYAVTALHCLRSVKPGDDGLDISFGSGEKISGRVHRRSQEADLALIDIPSSISNAALPIPGSVDAGEAWRSPYRPSTHHAYLNGNVDAVPISYRCESGDTIEALQLTCTQPIGDYSGYSGSPIERNHSQVRSVVGILLEQYPDQASLNYKSRRASTVLFAATIREIFRRFDCFAIEHLLEQLIPVFNENSDPSRNSAATVLPEDPASDSLKQENKPKNTPLANRIAATGIFLEALREYKDRGLLDGLDVSELKLSAIRRLMDGPIGDEP